MTDPTPARPATALVPLDGSDLSERALNAARAAVGPDGHLILLTVPRALGADLAWYYAHYGVPGSVPVEYPAIEEILAESRAEAEAYLAGVAARLEGEGVAATTVLAEDQPADAIAEAAAAHGVDLVAMATHGRGGLGRWALGSTATKVLQHAQAPVLVVRAGAERALERVDRIDVALDGSELAEAILPDVMALARRNGSVVRLVHVVQTPDHPVGADTVALQAEITKVAQTYLDEVAARLAGEGVAVTPWVTAGADVADVLLRCAEQDGADLVAMTTHGRGGFSRWTYGSVADRLIRHADAPLLVRRVAEER